MLFLWYPKCSTCGKAKRYLDEKNFSYKIRNIKEENPTFSEIKLWYQKSGLPIKKFFNTSGMLYKQYHLKDKLKNMSEEEQIKLLSTNGMLIKRPILITSEKIILGFEQSKYEKLV